MVPTDNMTFVASFRYKPHNNKIVINHKFNTCHASSSSSTRFYSVCQGGTPSITVTVSSVAKASTR
jgi:hypothetical protein